ncbi:hypothetical protein FB451DRAFT_1172924 [Mycena latifolia]|nr:hypothetical protein FB451DRAFT_1172924 [Mycena latifolia]
MSAQCGQATTFIWVMPSRRNGLPSRLNGLQAILPGLGLGCHQNPSPSRNKPFRADASHSAKPKVSLSGKDYLHMSAAEIRLPEKLWNLSICAPGTKHFKDLFLKESEFEAAYDFCPMPNRPDNLQFGPWFGSAPDPHSPLSTSYQSPCSIRLAFIGRLLISHILILLAGLDRKFEHRQVLPRNSRSSDAIVKASLMRLPDFCAERAIFAAALNGPASVRYFAQSYVTLRLCGHLSSVQLEKLAGEPYCSRSAVLQLGPSASLDSGLTMRLLDFWAEWVSIRVRVRSICAVGAVFFNRSHGAVFMNSLPLSHRRPTSLGALTATSSTHWREVLLHHLGKFELYAGFPFDSGSSHSSLSMPVTGAAKSAGKAMRDGSRVAALGGSQEGSGPRDAWRRANHTLITKWRPCGVSGAGDEPTGLAAGGYCQPRHTGSMAGEPHLQYSRHFRGRTAARLGIEPLPRPHSILPSVSEPHLLRKRPPKGAATQSREGLLGGVTVYE